MIKKTIAKDRLLNSQVQRFAKQECIIHSYMDHMNVVKQYEHVETDDEYILILEFCDKSSYLSQKILEVSVAFR